MNLTLTIIANLTSNYGENLGNIGSIQKVYKNQKMYATRSRESLKNAIMVQSGFYDDLKTVVDKKTTQKLVSDTVNASTCRALEGGYMNTAAEISNSKTTVIRNSSFHLTDAISVVPFINETRFHNNLFIAQTQAKQISEETGTVTTVQSDASKSGLMPYQYEYDKSLKIYSFTINLDEVGKDANYGEKAEATSEEKIDRVTALLDTIENLSLLVRGNLDNAEPILVVGGLTKRRTHLFENLVKITNNKLVVSDELKYKIEREDCAVGFVATGSLDNEPEIMTNLNPQPIYKFFGDLTTKVKDYYK